MHIVWGNRRIGEINSCSCTYNWKWKTLYYSFWKLTWNNFAPIVRSLVKPLDILLMLRAVWFTIIKQTWPKIKNIWNTFEAISLVLHSVLHALDTNGSRESPRRVNKNIFTKTVKYFFTKCIDKLILGRIFRKFRYTKCLVVFSRLSSSS